MGEPQEAMAQELPETQVTPEITFAPICQHEIYALAERLGFKPGDHVININLAPDHIDVTTADVDEQGNKLSKQVDGAQVPLTTTHRFAYTRYGTLWEHSHE